MQSAEHPPVIVYLCNWAAWRAYLDLSSSGAALPAALYPVRIPCAGRIDPAMILAAFERGAAGVIVAGCKSGECRHGSGPEHSQTELLRVRKMLHLFGQDPSRVYWLEADSNDSAAFGNRLAALVEKIQGGGPTAWAQGAGGV